MTQGKVIGRFAPTPSGPLHFGSLVTAVASYCHSKSQQGQWLLRIEDVDTPRVVKGATSQILTSLEAYGFEWDGEVLYQSSRFEYYESKLVELLDQQDCYACKCSRKSLREKGINSGLMGPIYPGVCRNENLTSNDHSIRLNTESANISQFNDKIYGDIGLNLKEQVGDFILKRVDGIYAYHLAVILDDDSQKINQVIRGADLLLSTCLHLYLQQRFKLPTPEYLHLPLITNSDGKKLSKQTGAKAIDINYPAATLISALEFLNQPTQASWLNLKPKAILQQAAHHWDYKLIKPEADIDAYEPS
ncbi:MAG: glutamyl-Q tRNA(Asp) synthetase [Candidatus Azotimanducaceae bacterium]|jgi:glutamyl-Q tRNA(Asp) synthetase